MLRAAYVHTDATPPALYAFEVVNGIRSPAVRVDDTGDVVSVAWAPDGAHLAFIASQRLYVTDDGSPVGEPREIPLPSGTTAGWRLAWSSQGRWLLFDGSTGGAAQLFVAAADATTPAAPIAELSDPEAEVYWSPTAARLAIVHAGDLTTVEVGAAGPEPPRLLAGDVARGFGVSPWSPDGRWLAYLAGDPSVAPVEAYAVPADDLGAPPLALARDRLGGETVVDARWSPGGSTLALRHGRRLTLVDMRGSIPGAAVGIDSARADWAPAWSPDGRHLAYTAMVEDFSQLFLVSIDDGVPARPVQLTRESSGAGAGTWAPDGSAIAYYADHGDYTGELYVAYVSPDGVSDPVLVSPILAEGGAHTYSERWSPDGLRIVFAAGHRYVAQPYLAAAGCDAAPAPIAIGPMLAAGRISSSTTWSPDARYVLATVGDSTEGQSALFWIDPSVPADFEALTPLDGGFVTNVSWAPIGAERRRP